MHLATEGDSDHGGHPSRSRAYDRFMAGMDTVDIAKKYRIREATALKWISHERSRRHELASPYEVRS